VRKLVDGLLGLPADRRDWLQDACREVGGLVEPFSDLDAHTISDRMAEFDDYFLALIEERRQHPGDDIISAFASQDDGPVLDADDRQRWLHRSDDRCSKPRHSTLG
jgi:cytochrome P450